MLKAINKIRIVVENSKRFLVQFETVVKAFSEKPMTMKEVDAKTGIMGENICRYVKTLLDEGRIAVIKKRKCTIKDHSYVNEYTANPELFPKSNQLDLFSELKTLKSKLI